MNARWRIVLAGLLLAASLWVFAFDQAGRRAAPVPEWHTNHAAAFRVRPPPGWGRRADDADGSQIAPPVQPEHGFSSLIVSMRFAVDPDALRHLADAIARPPAGPIRALSWGTPRRVTMQDGGAGAVVSFDETYRGAEVSGLMLVTVRDARLLQAVATVPRADMPAAVPALEAALLSLRPL